MLTDILATFAENPLRAGVWPSLPRAGLLRGRAAELASRPRRRGRDRRERRRLRVRQRAAAPPAPSLQPHALAGRTVTNGEWRDFIADGGYATPTLWLSDGWAWVQQEAHRGAALLAATTGR